MKEVLEELGLPKEAIDWLLMLWDSIQSFDDYMDDDAVNKNRLSQLIWDTLVGMPSNPFFVKNLSTLLPLMATAILKWEAANTVEANNKTTAMSFAWRAGFYDIVLSVYALWFGYEKAKQNAHIIMSLYCEKFEDYVKEIG